ncbi:MAG: hypothetical protein AUH85_03400 [Chloroflexi bacterium 13_1_40CM_4_68_4]|nr:MAG: hypothetical protein AUH85_03400 [Chloroflexi bacterium 13_1_40CM_4_68_4]
MTVQAPGVAMHESLWTARKQARAETPDRSWRTSEDERRLLARDFSRDELHQHERATVLH